MPAGRRRVPPVYPRWVGRATIVLPWPPTSSSPSGSTRRSPPRATSRRCGRSPAPTRSTPPTTCSSRRGAATGSSCSSARPSRGHGRRPDRGPDRPRPRARGCRSSPGSRSGWPRDPRCWTASSWWSTARVARTTTALRARLNGPTGRPVALLVFDILHLDGVWLLRTPLEKRRATLQKGRSGRATRSSSCPRSPARAGRSTTRSRPRGSRRPRAAPDVALPAGRAQQAVAVDRGGASPGPPPGDASAGAGRATTGGRRERDRPGPRPVPAPAVRRGSRARGLSARPSRAACGRTSRDRRRLAVQQHARPGRRGSRAASSAGTVMTSRPMRQHELPWLDAADRQPREHHERAPQRHVRGEPDERARCRRRAPAPPGSSP